jgi:NAD(P) transhydrogenase
VERLQGRGAFVDPHTIEVTAADGPTRRVSGEVILIATGSSPRRPDNFPFGHDRLWDSDNVLRMPFLPRRLAVIGGGVIGSEYACTFAALDVEVVLIDKRPDFMGFLDRDIAQLLQDRMTDLGVRIISPDGVKSCEAREDCAVLELDSGHTLETDAVFVAAGRTSNTGDLNLAAAGITVGSRGLIPVNDHYQTEVDHIYAAGDVIGFPALASTSMEQARLAMVKAFDLGYKDDAVPILPIGIYTIPEVSMAGETEAKLREEGVDYVVGTARYGGNPRGLIIGDYEGLLKLIFRREDMRLLGVQVLGEQASELVHVGLVALMCEASSELFIRTCFNYPTLGDLYKYATYDAMARQQSNSGAG